MLVKGEHVHLRGTSVVENSRLPSRVYGFDSQHLHSGSQISEL